MTLKTYLQDLSFAKDYHDIVRHAKGLLLALEQSGVHASMLPMLLQQPEPREEDERAFKTAKGCYEGIKSQIEMIDQAIEAKDTRQQESLEEEMDGFSYGQDVERIFHITLAGGGPACRITGQLDENNEPYGCVIEYQDWGTPWTEYRPADGDILEKFASRFYWPE